MKELSIEEKAKRYDEALGKARQLCAYPTTNPFISDLQDLFPELAESEDERIREEMLQIAKESEDSFYMVLTPNKREKLIAWLEKQGKETSWKPSKEEMDALYGIEDDVRRRSTIQVLEYARSLDTYNQYGKADIDKNIAWLEKQGEQKPVDKIEPKFHEGDWVVWDNKISCLVDNIYQGKESLMYTIIDTDNMLRTYSAKGFDNNAHLWTIGDAKDGDVLVASDDSIFIYKNQRDNGVVHYIAVTPCNDLEINENDYSWESKNACHPATKDEQTILFARMEEAGYEWDAEKKELKSK